jgi:hypothetical protein
MPKAEPLPAPPKPTSAEHVAWQGLVPQMKSMYEAAGEYGLTQAFLAVMSAGGTRVKVTITQPRRARAGKA